MKKKLVLGFLLLSLIACNKNDVTLKNIISVSSLDDIAVTYGTEFAAIPFPDHVSVTYSDNSTEEINVTFSQGSYNNTEAGTYALEGTLTITSGTTNIQNLMATVNVVVSPFKLKTVSQDGNLLYEYFYDSQSRLDHFKIYTSNTEYFYTYSADNKVTQRLRKLAGNDYPEKYFYHDNGTLDRIEFYYGDNILGQTHTYTYQNGKISKYDNSDQSINGLKFRTFDYDAQDNISKVSFDFGNPWSYTYFTDKKMATPLGLDLADPQNMTIHPVATFTFVELSSYTATYTYNAWNYPTEEVRTFPGDGNKQSTFTYTYE
jgi:hypothetical protein